MSAQTPAVAGETVRDYIEASPQAFAVLEEFGIKLDPFTIIALRCTPEELAEYSAVREPAALRRALQAAVSGDWTGRE